MKSLNYCYTMPPIDWWYGWNKISDLTLPPEDCLGFMEFVSFNSIQDVLRHLDYTLCEFDSGWEGDGDWMFSPIPKHDEDGDIGHCNMIFAIKQSNNGSTFILSPYELPWLKEYNQKKLRTRRNFNETY